MKPLLYAVNNGHLNVVEYLVNKKAEIHACVNNGQTLLHIAASSGKLGLVECLVVKGANINAQTNDSLFLLVELLLFI